MKHRKIIYLSMLILLLSGCHRDELCFSHPQNAWIELKVDWQRSALNANSATAVIYRDGNYYSTEVISVYPPVRKLINLPVGHYNIVLHNEQASDFQHSLLFAERERWNDFQVAPLDDTPPGRRNKQPVDTLAADRHIDFVVTPEMLGENHQHPTSLKDAQMGTDIGGSITFTPRRLFTEVTVVLNVLNGNGYYFATRTPPLLNGMAGAYFMGSDRYSDQTANHSLALAPMPKTGVNKTVTFYTSQLCIGLAGRNGTETGPIQGNYSLSLPFAYAGGMEMREIDLQNDAVKFRFTPEDPTDPNNNWDRLEIEVDIELPELILVGDMDVGLEDWTDVDIPLDGPQRLHFVANNGNGESFWQTNMAGVVINMPAPTLFSPVEGLVFVEWNSTADGTGTPYQPGDIYEMKRGGAIFYAIWKRQT